MGRLTKRLGDQVILNEVGITDCGKICDRRKDFDIPCDDCPIDDAFHKLAHYEDLEEAGRLIEMHCAVGDMVWYIKEESSLYPSYHTYYDWYDFHIGYITLTKRGIVFGRRGSGMFDGIMFNANDIGKTVFLTKEEALAKLKELEGDKE